MPMFNCSQGEKIFSNFMKNKNNNLFVRLASFENKQWNPSSPIYEFEWKYAGPYFINMDNQ